MGTPLWNVDDDAEAIVVGRVRAWRDTLGGDREVPMSDGDEIELRNERDGDDRRRLWARVDEHGDVHIDGQDLGPATRPVSNDGEYEWFQVIRAAHVPRLLEVLGAPPGSPVVDVLRGFCGDRSYDLEELLRESDVPVERQVW